jgi:hypothetical protein
MVLSEAICQEVIESQIVFNEARIIRVENFSDSMAVALNGMAS